MVVFINKGEPYLKVPQATSKGIKELKKELTLAGAIEGDEELFRIVSTENLPSRLLAILANLGYPTYEEYALAWATDNSISAMNNHFNNLLEKYRKAQERLSNYRLADGQVEESHEEPTNEIDENGNVIMITVVDKIGIDPLPATVSVPVYDPVTGEHIGDNQVPNPDIIKDDNERDEAQQVIYNTPTEVVTFAANNPQ